VPAILLLLAFAELRGYDLRAILNCFFACFIAFALWSWLLPRSVCLAVFDGTIFLSFGYFNGTSVFCWSLPCLVYGVLWVVICPICLNWLFPLVCQVRFDFVMVHGLRGITALSDGIWTSRCKRVVGWFVCFGGDLEVMVMYVFGVIRHGMVYLRYITALLPLLLFSYR